MHPMEKGEKVHLWVSTVYQALCRACLTFGSQFTKKDAETHQCLMTNVSLAQGDWGCYWHFEQESSRVGLCPDLRGM